MLNELYQLSVVLEDKGIRPYEWHKHMKLLPQISAKRPCYRILVCSDGSIPSVEPIKKETVSLLRKWQQGSNGFSFPGFNILPFYTTPGEEEKELLEAWKNGKKKLDKTILRKWCVSENETEYNKKMLNECLGKIPREMKKRCSEIPDEFSALRSLLERVESAWGNDGCSIFVQALNTDFRAAI